jgi:esterase/lipase
VGSGEAVVFFCYLKLLVAVLNSPIVIAVLSVSLGGVVAAALSSRYQRRQQVFELRAQAL